MTGLCPLHVRQRDNILRITKKTHSWAQNFKTNVLVKGKRAVAWSNVLTNSTRDVTLQEAEGRLFSIWPGWNVWEERKKVCHSSFSISSTTVSYDVKEGKIATTFFPKESEESGLGSLRKGGH